MSFRTKLCLAALLLTGSVSAQAPSVAERLVELLAERGVVTPDDRAEVVSIAEQARDRAALLTSLDAMIATLSSRDEDVTLRHGARGGWRFATQDGRFSLRIAGRASVRITHDVFDRNPSTNNEDETDFRARAMRMKIDGKAFERWLSYKLLLSFDGDQSTTVVEDAAFDSDNALVEIKDAYLEAAPSSAFRLRAGQQRVPYSRQSMTPQRLAQFTDRSIIHREFGRSRDVGLMLHGAALGPQHDLLEWYAGVFDGEGENRPRDESGMLWTGRVVLNPLGGVPYAESDIEGSESVRLALGLGAWLHDGPSASRPGDDWSIGVDLAARWDGLFFLGEAHLREDARDGRDARSFGWLLQVGWFVVPSTLEVGLRAAHIDWRNNGSGRSARREYLAVLGWFQEGHALKVQLDFGRVEEHFGDQAAAIDGWRTRLQVQVGF